MTGVQDVCSSDLSVEGEKPAPEEAGEEKAESKKEAVGQKKEAKAAPEKKEGPAKKDAPAKKADQ